MTKSLGTLPCCDDDVAAGLIKWSIAMELDAEQPDSYSACVLSHARRLVDREYDFLES
jgi:hypothetical protein